MQGSARGPTKVFILVADTDVKEDTLTRRVLKASLEVLSTSAYQVTMTDCAKEGWLQPISSTDFQKLSDPVHINMQTEQMVSPVLQKIQDEQNKLLQCDLFLVFAPLTWFGPPSLFYAWWERVVTMGRCYGPGMMYQTGAFARKKALMVMVSNQRQELYGRDTMHGTIEEILYPITHGMLYPVGFKVHRTQTLYLSNPEKMDEIIGKWQTALRDLEERTSIVFNQPNDYTNWKLSTPEKDRRNDLEILTRYGDMSIQEATMKLSSPLE